MKSLKSLAWILALLLCSTRLLALDYSNPQLGFKVKLPDGLEDLSGQTRVKTLISRGRLDGANNSRIELICIQDLGATIGRDALSKTAGKFPGGTLEKAAWKSFQIDVFRVVENVKSVSFVTFNAQVPLKPRAIQLTVSGPTFDEDNLRKELHTILASVEGPTNWLTAEESTRRPRQNLVSVAIGLFALIVGKLRITRHYGLAGTGARVAGFVIIAAGIALPMLTAPVLRLVHHHGANVTGMLFAWIGFNALVIWGIIALLVMHYGNAYARGATDAVPPLPASAAPQPSRPVALVTQCPMCQSPIAPDQQATARTCPACGADLARARRAAGAVAGPLAA